MSQSVPYTPPDYVPPEVDSQAWSGRERRSRDPVNQLSRSFNRLCLEASDRFEIVAHLEALGYNSPNALRRLGVQDHFALADALYSRTPKTFAPYRPVIRAERDWAGPIAMVLAFLVTFALGAFSTATVLAPAIWVLVWSQAGAALLGKAHEEMDAAGRERLLTVLMQVGLIGIAGVALVTGFGLEAGAPTFLWYAVAGLLWDRRSRSAVALPLVVCVALAADVAWLHMHDAPQLAAVVASLAACVPLLWRRTGQASAWAARRSWVTFFPTLYGLGQGLLIVSLLRHGPDDGQVVAGASLLALVLLTSRALLMRLKGRLIRRLWRHSEDRRFVWAARRAVAAYAATYLVPIAGAVAVQAAVGPQAWHFHWYAFALFGLCLALAVVGFTLGDAATPGICFLLAGTAGAAGAGFLLVCGVLALVQLALLLWRCAHVERYAVHLL